MTGSSGNDNVMPFRRRNAPKPLPPEQAALHRRTQRAQPGARALAAEQADAARAGYMTALSRQKAEQLIAAGKIVPARITLALDICGLEGPEVDEQCGAAEPDVDMWEAGLSVPTREQVWLLAKLTEFEPAFFYMPIEPGPLTSGIIVCHGSRKGCEALEPDVLTEDGVLLYEGKPRDLPKPAQQTLF